MAKKIRSIGGVTIENIRKFAKIFFGEQHVHKVCIEPGTFIILLSDQVPDDRKEKFKDEFPNVRYMSVTPDN